MPTLVEQRCWQHPARAAAARCPECRRYFCRECITEHEGRILCAACVKKFAAGAQTARRHWTAALRYLSPLAGLLIAWSFFYYLGRILLSIPAEFHG